MVDAPIKAKPRIKRGWMPLRVEKIIEETHDTKTFLMVDADEGGRPFDFRAGQYLTFRFDDLGPRPVVRSYTISGSPCQAEHTILTVKRVEGGLVSNWLCDAVTVGTILRARGPIGKFCYDPQQDHDHLFFVAGGSGVTPFVSIMRQYLSPLSEEKAPKSMSLLVAYRTQQDLILWNDLQEINAHPNMRVITTLTREHAEDKGFWHGRPTPLQLDQAMNESYTNLTVMTCGPQAMMDMVASHCRQRGVAPDHIKTESFES